MTRARNWVRKGSLGPARAGSRRSAQEDLQHASAACQACKSRASKNRKTSDLVELLNPRQHSYLEGVVSGKTKKAAALAAGYSESTARTEMRPAVIERPLVRLALQEMVRQAIPPEKIVQRLVDGLDATNTVFAKHKGKITDQLTVIAWNTRLLYIGLAAKMAGYYVEGQDLTDELSKTLESRSNEELDYFLAYGHWPEEAAKATHSVAELPCLPARVVCF